MARSPSPNIPSRSSRSTASVAAELPLHTAPDAQPPTNVLRSGLIAGLPPFPVGPEPWLSNAAPLVQSHSGPSTLLRAAPPLCHASLLWSSRFLPIGPLPSHRDDRFSRSIRNHCPASRRLCAGSRSGRLQDHPKLVPRDGCTLGFDIITGISTCHQRFALARLSRPHLTGSCPAFCCNANHHCSLRQQLTVV